MWYDGGEPLNINSSDIATAAEFDWRQAAVAVVITGKEARMNAGKEQLIDLLDLRVGNAQRTMKNQMSTAIYSDGTAYNGKQLQGLAVAVPDTPTSGTYGGINRATYSWWRNQTYSFATNSKTASAATVQDALLGLWQSQVRGADQPDLGIADNTYWGYFHQSLMAIQRFTDESSDMRKAGFRSLKFMNADIVLDGGYGGAATANHIWLLNTDYIHYNVHKDCNMVPLDPDRNAINQDATVDLWSGALVQ